MPDYSQIPPSPDGSGIAGVSQSLPGSLGNIPPPPDGSGIMGQPQPQSNPAASVHAYSSGQGPSGSMGPDGKFHWDPVGFSIPSQQTPDARKARLRQAILNAGHQPISSTSPLGKPSYKPGAPRDYRQDQLSSLPRLSPGQRPSFTPEQAMQAQGEEGNVVKSRLSKSPTLLSNMLDYAMPEEGGFPGLGQSLSDPKQTPGAGATRFAMGAVTPENAAIMTGLGAAPKIVQLAATRAFQVLMAKNAGEHAARGEWSDAAASGVGAFAPEAMHANETMQARVVARDAAAQTSAKMAIDDANANALNEPALTRQQGSDALARSDAEGAVRLGFLNRNQPPAGVPNYMEQPRYAVGPDARLPARPGLAQTPLGQPPRANGLTPSLPDANPPSGLPVSFRAPGMNPNPPIDFQEWVNTLQGAAEQRGEGTTPQGETQNYPASKPARVGLKTADSLNVEPPFQGRTPVYQGGEDYLQAQQRFPETGKKANASPRQLKRNPDFLKETPNGVQQSVDSGSNASPSGPVATQGSAEGQGPSGVAPAGAQEVPQARTPEEIANERASVVAQRKALLDSRATKPWTPQQAAASDSLYKRMKALDAEAKAATAKPGMTPEELNAYANKVLGDNSGKLTSGIDPTDIPAMIRNAAEGARNIKEAIEKAVAKYGEGIRPYIVANSKEIFGGMKFGVMPTSPVTAPGSPAQPLGGNNAPEIPEGGKAPSEATPAKDAGLMKDVYAVDKESGDLANRLVASRETGKRMGYRQGRIGLSGLTPEQVDLVGRKEISDELNQGVSEGVNINARQQILTPAEEAQVAADPKIQDALAQRQEAGKRLLKERQVTNPDLTVRENAAGGFASLHATIDSEGNPIPIRNLQGEVIDTKTGDVVDATQQQAFQKVPYTRSTTHSKQRQYSATEYLTDPLQRANLDWTEVTQKANMQRYYNRLLQIGQISKEAQPGWQSVDIGRYGIKGPDGELAGQVYMPPQLAKPVRLMESPAPAHTGVFANVVKKANEFSTAASLATTGEFIGHAKRQLDISGGIPNKAAGVGTQIAEAHLPPAVKGGMRLAEASKIDVRDPYWDSIEEDIFNANRGSTRPFSTHITAKTPVIGKWQAFTQRKLFGMPENGPGTDGLDLRLRMLAEHYRRQYTGNTDPQQIRQLQDRFGQYVSHPDNIVAMMKKVNPFAGSQVPMRLAEIKQLAGQSGMKSHTPGKAVGLAAQTAYGKVVGGLGTFALANYLISGHGPWDNADGHKLDLQVGVDKDGEPLYVGGSAFMPALYRALNTFGVGQMTKGDNITDVATNVARGVGNTGLGSVSSPLAQTATQAAFDRKPYVVGKGTDNHLMGSSPSASDWEDMGVNSLAGRGINTAREINPLIGNVSGQYLDRKGLSEYKSYWAKAASWTNVFLGQGTVKK